MKRSNLASILFRAKIRIDVNWNLGMDFSDHPLIVQGYDWEWVVALPYSSHCTAQATVDFYASLGYAEAQNLPHIEEEERLLREQMEAEATADIPY